MQYDDILEAKPGGAFNFSLHPAVKWPLATAVFAFLTVSIFVGHEALHCVPRMLVSEVSCTVTINHPSTWAVNGYAAAATPGTNADHWWIWPVTVAMLAGAWLMWADTVGD